MKRWGTLLHQSLKAVFAFKLRGFFCLLSVALGIASITIIVGATEGAYRKAFEIVERFGPDSMLIVGGSEESRAIGVREKTISVEDVEAIRESFPTAYLVVPMSSTRGVTVSYGNRKHQTTIVGSTGDYSRMWSWPVVEGTDLTDRDVQTLKNIALVGTYVVEQLFGAVAPVGKYIFVRNIPVRVVGVLEERGTSPAGHSMDDRIIMPLTTVMRKILNETTYVSSVRVRFLDAADMERHQEELRRFLRERHRTPPGEPDDFRIISPREIVKFLVALTGSLVVFLGITGIMSLVVAGFVLANLFLLSVNERRREIGLRRSVGARRRDILFQFLGESVILTGMGGVVGFVGGLLAARLLTFVADFPMYFSWKAFAAGFGLSLLIGLIFGLQPASRAALVNPIDAIRNV